jgi:hypothetical protein
VPSLKAAELLFYFRRVVDFDFPLVVDFDFPLAVCFDFPLAVCFDFERAVCFDFERAAICVALMQARHFSIRKCANLCVVQTVLCIVQWWIGVLIQSHFSDPRRPGQWCGFVMLHGDINFK